MKRFVADEVQFYGEIIMAGRTLKEVLASLPSDERKAIKERTRELVAEEMSLRDLRKAMGKTQTAVARRLKIGQEAVSKIESRSDMLISTLRSYLRSGGGDLELMARLPDGRRVRLKSFEEVRPERPRHRQRSKRAASATDRFSPSR